LSKKIFTKIWRLSYFVFKKFKDYSIASKII